MGKFELTILSIGFITTAVLIGQINCRRGYDEYCDVTPNSWYTNDIDQSRTCDPNQGLYCMQHTSRCGCFIPGSVYIDGACRAKINHPCVGPGNVRTECVRDSVCDTSISYFCRCREGFEPWEDNMGCSSGNLARPNFINLVIPSVILLFLVKFI